MKATMERRVTIECDWFEAHTILHALEAASMGTGTDSEDDEFDAENLHDTLAQALS